MNHFWGDLDFDWKALDDAGYYIQRRCRQFARMGLHIKEKYGTLRISTTCAYTSEYDFLYHLIHPGYIYYNWPKWVRQYIDWPLGKTMKMLGVIYILQRWQRFTLKFFWKRAAKKWPHIREEILDDYEWEFE